MIRRGYKSRVPSSSHLSHVCGQELAPDVPLGGTGCYGVIGPVPSTVLDKEKVFRFKRTTADVSII
jgi:hypothetical protein